MGAGKNDREYWAQLMPDAVTDHDQLVSPPYPQHLNAACDQGFRLTLASTSVPVCWLAQDVTPPPPSLLLVLYVCPAVSLVSKPDCQCYITRLVTASPALLLLIDAHLHRTAHTL